MGFLGVTSQLYLQSLSGSLPLSALGRAERQASGQQAGKDMRVDADTPGSPPVLVDLSPAALDRARWSQTAPAEEIARDSGLVPSENPDQVKSAQDSTQPEKKTGQPDTEPQPEKASSSGNTQGIELTPEEKVQVQDLKARDREVRAHEQAHIAAGGGYVKGGATYTYETGPDGKRYAVGGEVSIDASKEPDPEATVRKAQAVRKAALAPARPSSQDRAVAAKATRMEQEARAELSKEKKEQTEDSESSGAISGFDRLRIASYAQNSPQTAETASSLNLVA